MSIVRRAAFHAALSTALALVALASIAAMPGARAWAANAPGGISIREPKPEPAAPAGRAMIVSGRAIAPLDAPAAVKRVIAAANQIRTKPYIWGGGHGRWWDRGYDCSGRSATPCTAANCSPARCPRARWRPGDAGAGPLDHGLRQRRPRLRGDRRPALGHRRRHQRHRPPLAQGSDAATGAPS